MTIALVPCTVDKLIVGPFNILLDGHDMGSTTGGVSITQNREYTEVRNDQSSTVQGIIQTQQDFIITATMRDMTLDKLRVLWGVKEGLSDDGLTLCVTDNSTVCAFPEEFDLLVCGPGPGCGCRTFYFPRVVIVPSSVEILIQRETPVEVAVEFRALASCPDGNILCATDVCDMYATDEVTLVSVPSVEQADTIIPDYVAPA